MDSVFFFFQHYVHHLQFFEILCLHLVLIFLPVGLLVVLLVVSFNNTFDILSIFLHCFLFFFLHSLLYKVCCSIICFQFPLYLPYFSTVINIIADWFYYSLIRLPLLYFVLSVMYSFNNLSMSLKMFCISYLYPKILPYLLQLPYVFPWVFFLQFSVLAELHLLFPLPIFYSFLVVFLSLLFCLFVFLLWIFCTFDNLFL